MTTCDIAEECVRSETTETATIGRLASGVVVFEPHPGVRFTREHVVENNRAIVAMAGDGPVLLLARMTGISHMDRDSREYSASYTDRHYRKVALLVENAMSRMLASFFLGFNKPEMPTRAFEDRARAETWLLEGH